MPIINTPLFSMRTAQPPLLLALLLVACQGQRALDAIPVVELQGTAYEAAALVSLEDQPAWDHEDLQNVFFLSSQIISGGEPESEEAFERLAEWGIKTILSVDGKAPLAEVAERFGMRYVHVPIQYKGITEGELLRMTKTFRELPGPFYVHCFHGKHRGPAAAAVGRIVLDHVPREQALAEMRQWMGTSPAYEGLYATIASCSLPSMNASSAYQWDFTPAVGTSGMKEAMVMATRALENLKSLEGNAWAVDPTHPDLVPEQEALRLAEIFRRSLGGHDLRARPASFRASFEGIIPAAEELAARVSQARQVDKQGIEQAAALMTRIEGSCNSCHKQWRD